MESRSENPFQAPVTASPSTDHSPNVAGERSQSPDRPQEPLIIWQENNQTVENLLGDELFGWKLIFMDDDYALFSHEDNGQTRYTDVYLKK